MHRIAGIIEAEHGADGVRAFNVQPGLIATERIAADMGEFGISGGAPTDVVGAVVAHLLEHPHEYPAGRTVEAQAVCHRLGLVPDWEGPVPNTDSPIRFDLSGAEAQRLAEEVDATTPS